jgi:hypothetical protein
MTSDISATPKAMASGTRIGRSATIGAALLTITAGFQLALAMGAPWGRAAWGGTHSGVLPNGLRIGSGIAVAVYLVVAAICLDRLVHGRARRWVLRVVSVFLGVGVLMNAASQSWIESLLWVPMSLAMCVCLWLASCQESAASARLVSKNRV